MQKPFIFKISLFLSHYGSLAIFGTFKILNSVSAAMKTKSCRLQMHEVTLNEFFFLFVSVLHFLLFPKT